MKKILTIVIIIVVVLVGWFMRDYFQNQQSDRTPKGDVPNDDTSMNWQTYTNDMYSFTLEHPEDWEVRTSETPTYVAIHVLPKAADYDLPITHHNNATHVSIYPRGIPTEGVLGSLQPTSLRLQPPRAQGTDYVLRDGMVWATLLSFDLYPDNWNQSGFVWGAVALENEVVNCRINGELLDRDACSLPLPAGAEIVRDASFSSDEREIVDRILTSFAFTEDVTVQQAPVRLRAPQAQTIVTSPLEVTGEARGTWYFEATFPVKLTDANGNTIVESYAEAQGEWMTEEFVPFAAVLSFENPPTPTGNLILQKANPSGLPENDGEIVVPVRFE